MRARSLIFTLISTLTLNAAAALAAPDDLFQKGLAAYQNKQYSEAREAFQKLLEQGNESPALLNNMALTVFQLDQKPFALALWRKALSLRPGFQPALRGRELLESKMQMRPMERDSFSLWFRRLLESVSLHELLWLNALILALTGWVGIRYFGERSAALEDELPLPAFPTATVVSSALLAVSLAMVTFKIKDILTARATVIGQRVSARSLPADDSVGLFDLNGGSEVLVRRKQSGWTQVQNADSATGWVKDTEIYITSAQ